MAWQKSSTTEPLPEISSMTIREEMEWLMAPCLDRLHKKSSMFALHASGSGLKDRSLRFSKITHHANDNERSPICCTNLSGLEKVQTNAVKVQS
ncbi:hypothetical protein RND71_014392 [Anisodus tanguticus]|uniref:Uncharacterized protein n=1 Tax=Anisodus tanguticus TaxID=243964 RepID=A0AAE1SBP9_9SOLA|nr:hypothetical protein RND71_014392 [Anisodus tanguticus]